MNRSPILDSVLEEIMARWDIPGLGVGMIDSGSIIHACGYGVQSLATSAPVTPDSIFCVASMAKCFVACAAMQLVEQGLLDLDAPLVDYLPDFKLDDDHYQEITLRQILSHTSGMPDMDEMAYIALVSNPEYDEEAPKRYMQSLVDRKLIALPGERFAYSNIAYNVLGHLLSRQTGLTFEDYMKAQILTPAGMADSTFFFPEVPLERLAVPHLRTPQLVSNPILPYHRADAPASFLYTTVNDLCQWAMITLNRGIYQGRRILSASSYEHMWTPVANRGYPPFREEMGLGWALGHFAEFKTVGHGGGGFGWTCHLILLPEKNAAAIILCNEESSSIERLEEAVLLALLGRQPTPGPVSWMVPVARALSSGGVGAAHDCFEEIKHNSGYFLDPDELITLVYQLLWVRKYDLAKDVLKMNLRLFPDHRHSIILLEKLEIK